VNHPPLQSPLSDSDFARLLELVADETLQILSAEDIAQLADLRERASDEQLASSQQSTESLGALLLAMDSIDDEPGMPAALRSKLAAKGQRLVGSLPEEATPRQLLPRRGMPMGAVGAVAAMVAIGAAIGSGWWFFDQLNQRESELLIAQDQVRVLEARMSENQQVLAAAQSRLNELQERIAANEGTITQQELALAAEQARSIELATQLAAAGERFAQAQRELDAAEITIAKYEEPVDPAVLAADRLKLLEVPDTIRVAWAPFDLPDAPAEQRQVQGDVVWNDELQHGYLRFVGLEPNDPDIEQYQVWIIDERGLEQKVSGGVFNATADVEIIVQLEPGIDVGRVALFAVTVENPGGTWVPDLTRRVVVAPRSN
jgi:hypothetical protein